MSRRATRWLLWGVFLATVPVPYLLGPVGFAPTLRVGFLTALYAAIYASEGGRNVGMLTGIGAVQTGLYAALCLGAAALAARLLQRLLEPRPRGAVVALLAGALLSASLFDIYQTPLSSTRSRSSLLQLFD